MGRSWPAKSGQDTLIQGLQRKTDVEGRMAREWGWGRGSGVGGGGGEGEGG